MKYPLSMSYAEIVKDYYENHADEDEKNVIEDTLVSLLGELCFTIDIDGNVVTADELTAEG